MKRYLSLLATIWSFTLKTALEYRFNFFVQLWYGPAYAAVMLLLLITAYSKSPEIAGFSFNEGLLLFSVFHLIYLTAMMFFMRGVRYFLWEGIRHGQLDLVLTKPISTQFLTFFFRPEFQQIAMWLASLGLFVRQLIILHSQITVLNFVLFVLLAAIGLGVIYFSLVTYATTTFFVTRAQQIIELFDKISDSSQYPTPIFPQSLVMVFFTFVPIGFFGYTQTLFLLGRGDPRLFILSLIILVIFYGIQRYSWSAGLKRYSSASS